MGWDLLAVIPWLVFFATGAVMVGVYAVAGLFGRDAGHIGELFEGLFELATGASAARSTPATRRSLSRRRQTWSTSA